MKGTIGFLVWLAIMLAFMYFMVYRPQKKQENAARVLQNSLTPGDTIETIGGFTGRVVSIKEDTLVVETSAERSKLRLARWAIQQNNTAVERANEARKAAAKEAKNAQ